MKVIVPIVAGIGNALMAEPMVRQLKRARPDAKITVIARIAAMGEPFRRMPEVDEVLISGGGWRGIFRKLIWMRRRRSDVLLVPFPSNRWQYNLLARLSGAKRRIMHRFDNARFRSLGFLSADRIPAVRGIHDVEQNLRLLEALNISPNLEDAPKFNLTSNDRTRALKMLHDAEIEESDEFIVIHAGSAQTILGRAKRWPAAKYAQLLELLRREVDLKMVLIEGPDEEGVADEILAAIGEMNPGNGIRGLVTIRLRGPLGDAAALLARSRIYVGSDSGLAHLAAAVGTIPVTIFAPADPERVCPFGYRELVVRPNKSCSPCFQYPWHTPYPKMRCREPYCVAEVTVDAVMDAVRRAISLIKDSRNLPATLQVQHSPFKP